MPKNKFTKENIFEIICVTALILTNFEELTFCQLQVKKKAK